MFKKYIHFVFRILSINWIVVLLINILLIAHSFIGTIVMANISKYLIDNVFVSQKFDNLKYIIPVYIIFYFLNLFFELVSTYLIIKWKIKIDYQLKNRFYARMTEIKYENLEKITASELYYRMFQDGAFMSGYVYILCIVLPSSLFCTSIILLTMFKWSVSLSLFTILLVIGQLLNLMFIKKPVERINQKQKKINQFIVNFIMEKLEYIDQTKAGNFKDWWINRTYDEFEKARVVTEDNQYKSTLLGEIISFFQELWTIGFLILGGFLSINGLCTVGLFFSFQSLINCLLLPLNKVFDAIYMFQETKVSFSRYIEYYNLPAEEKTHQKFKFESCLEVRNIRFSYDSNSKDVFHNFSMKADKNSLIGIKGESGSGKTTLLKLCARLLNVDSGGIYIDGINIDKIDISSFRENFNFMLQSSVIFEDTFKSNITLGLEIKDAEICSVINKCHLENVVDRLPNGINSIVGKGYTQFSKGEVQRIALARILIRKPSIIWLDEPTAALDEETERLIINTIVNIKNEMHCLVIVNSHSKNLLDRVDKVISL